MLIVFALVYCGMAVGRVPGLKLDRTGIAVIGAILLFGAGAIDGTGIHAAIDYPTLVLLFSLMVISAQFTACGFYDRCAWMIASAAVPPAVLLGAVVVIAGALSALLSNDVVVFAMTPMLCAALKGRDLDPRPFLIALAGGANAGSAATLIGNPQNILIGQSGNLDFWAFFAACAVPAALAMLAVYGVLRWQWRGMLGAPVPHGLAGEPPALDQGGLIRAGLGVLALLVLFATPLPRDTGALLVAGALMISRRQSTRDMLAAVDWPLLLLFAALFVVTGAMAASGLLAQATAALKAAGIALGQWPVIAALSLAISNSIGNVPGVILILASDPQLPAAALHALAIFSTLAGNLLIVGSLANIIVVEQAEMQGVRLGFRTHAAAGIPMTLLSFLLVMPWIAFVVY